MKSPGHRPGRLAGVTAFPREIRRQIWSGNPQGRLNTAQPDPAVMTPRRSPRSPAGRSSEASPGPACTVRSAAAGGDSSPPGAALSCLLVSTVGIASALVRLNADTGRPRTITTTIRRCPAPHVLRARSPHPADPAPHPPVPPPPHRDRSTSTPPNRLGQPRHVAVVALLIPPARVMLPAGIHIARTATDTELVKRRRWGRPVRTGIMPVAGPVRGRRGSRRAPWGRPRPGRRPGGRRSGPRHRAEQGRLRTPHGRAAARRGRSTLARGTFAAPKQRALPLPMRRTGR